MAPRPVPVCDVHAESALRVMRQAFPDRTLFLKELAALPAICVVCNAGTTKGVAAVEEEWILGAR